MAELLIGVLSAILAKLGTDHWNRIWRWMLRVFTRCRRRPRLLRGKSRPVRE